MFTNTKMESVINAPLQPPNKGASPESGVWGLISKASVLWGGWKGACWAPLPRGEDPKLD